MLGTLAVKLLRLLPVRTPKGSAAAHAVFHRVPVRAVEPLTEDSVAITFDVPEALREEFAFKPGQHLVGRADAGGDGVLQSQPARARG